MMNFRDIENVDEFFSSIRYSQGLDIAKLKNMLKYRKEKIRELNEFQFLQNKHSKNYGKVTINASYCKELSEKIKIIKSEVREIESTLDELFFDIPNVLKIDVPVGKSERDNLVLCEVGNRVIHEFNSKSHEELGENLDILDFKKASLISGARFVFLKGLGSALSRALLQYFCNYHVAKGDVELLPPYLVKAGALIGTGQFPKFYQDVFEVNMRVSEKQNLYLIPTSEVPVTNYHMNQIVDLQQSKRYCAYSSCFRSEAGAAGKDANGLIRLHQFEKVEMVRFCMPDDSEKEFNLMILRASQILSNLELPHRIVFLCAGDTGFSSQKTYDLEVWFPAQNRYREVSSCSDFGVFQSSRCKIKYKDENGRNKLVATLNGSGFPLGRVIAAILENNQNEDGSVNVPRVLQPYLGGISQIKKI